MAVEDWELIGLALDRVPDSECKSAFLGPLWEIACRAPLYLHRRVQEACPLLDKWFYEHAPCEFPLAMGESALTQSEWREAWTMPSSILRDHNFHSRYKNVMLPLFKDLAANDLVEQWLAPHRAVARAKLREQLHWAQQYVEQGIRFTRDKEKVPAKSLDVVAVESNTEDGPRLTVLYRPGGEPNTLRFSYRLGAWLSDWEFRQHPIDLSEWIPKFEKWYALKRNLHWLLTLHGPLAFKDATFYLRPGGFIVIDNASHGAPDAQSFEDLAWFLDTDLTTELSISHGKIRFSGRDISTLVQALEWVLARDAIASFPDLFIEFPTCLCLIIGGYLGSEELPPRTGALHWPTATATDVLLVAGWSRINDAAVSNASRRTAERGNRGRGRK
jgi:hypothetical protein